MKKIFDELDFIQNSYSHMINSYLAADIANKKIEKLMADWPVVYGPTVGFWDTRHPAPGYKYQARLAFIEPIKRECKHEPNQIWTCNNHPLQKFICSKCNIELEAEWKVKGEK